MPRGHRITDGQFHLLACSGYSVLLVCWAVHAGRDLSFDLLNYHFYAGFSLLHDRFNQDLMAASLQGYLNPLAYVPFYLLVSAGLPSVAVVACLAALHSVNLWLLHAIGWSIFRSGERRTHTVLAVLLSAACPVFLIEAGTSYNDIWALMPLLLMVLAVLKLLDGTDSLLPSEAGPQAATRSLIVWAAVAGLAAGVAIGLKLTSLIPVLAMALLALVACCVSARWRRALFPMGSAALLGFLIVHAEWGARVWAATGNPMFPQFDPIFNSVDPVVGASRHLRFIPLDWIGALATPIRMLRPYDSQYIEATAPDARPLVCLVLGLVLAVITLRAHLTGRPAVVPVPHFSRGALLCTFLGVYAALWLSMSGNGRYGLLLLTLLGVALTAAARTLLAGRRAAALLAAVLALQTVQQVVGADARMLAENHASTWFDIEPDARLLSTPVVILSAGVPSASFLAPFAHPDSVFIDVGMQYPVRAGDSRRLRLEQLLQTAWPAYAVFDVHAKNEHGDPVESNLQDPRMHLRALGLAMDRGDCVPVGMKPHRLQFTLAEQPPLGSRELANQAFLACRVQGGAPVSPMPASVLTVFRRIESQCPALFAPAGAVVHDGRFGPAGQIEDRYFAMYTASDSRVLLKGRNILVDSYRQVEPLFLGSLDGLDQTLAALDCKDLRRRLMGTNSWF